MGSQGPSLGTSSASDVKGLTRIVRGGDAGDSYNYAPPTDDILGRDPLDQRFETVEEGPLRRVDVLHRTYMWDEKQVETGTRFEQRAGEPFVRIRSTSTILARPARPRAHPAARAGGSLHAEGQFGIVERGLQPEGGYGEVAIRPTQRHVRRCGRRCPSPRSRHRIRGRRRRARADSAPLDRV